MSRSNYESFRSYAKEQEMIQREEEIEEQRDKELNEIYEKEMEII